MTTKAKNGTQELVAALEAQTKQEKGLGYMWTESTHAVGSTFGMLGNLAVAGNQLAAQAKRNAVMSNLQSSKEICEVLGIEAEGIDQLTVADAIVDYICSRR
jgi:hypothetical protein